MHNAAPQLHLHRHAVLTLESGAVLAGACTAFRTLGRLDPDGRNAVLVLHGYTTGPAMLEAGANVAEGSWSELVGPGKAVDSERCFVVCPNMLGSSYGSTGPASVNPATGRPYGIDFPRLTLRDIVDVQKDLLDALGVQRLAAVVGPSLGGYQALQWAVSHPGMVDRVVAAVSAPWNPPGAVQSGALRAQLEAQPAWNGGHPAPGAMVDWLTALRVTTLTRYGVDDELRARIPDATARAAELQRLAREWAAGFDPNALLTLALAAESFDLRGELQAIRAPLLMVNSRSDLVFSPALAREFAPVLDAAGVPWSYVELDSDKGHVASGADAALWAGTLRRFMDTPPDAWLPWGLRSGNALAPTPPGPTPELIAQLKAMLPGIPDHDLPRFAASLSVDEPYTLGADSQRNDVHPRGSLSARQCAPGRHYPGVAHDYTVYIAAQVSAERPATLLVFQDGARYLGPEVDAPAVLDRLIAEGALPPAVAVFVNPGAQGPGLPIYGGSDNRSVEYDSGGDTYVRFLLEELLPEATAGLRISSDPAQRAIVGLSSGGACAFNAAWERPDAFGKVVSHCGSFVDIRGAHRLASAVRRGPAKALKVFLQTGEHDLNIVFGDWVQANRELASALAYRGIEHRLVVGRGGHSLRHGGAIFPDTLRWLWSDTIP